LKIPERTAQIGNRAVLGLAGVVALAGVIAGLAAIGNPVSWTGDRWSDFKDGHFEYQTGGSARFGQSLGSNRYDFWRVAADEFTSAPIAGVGSDNFAEDYVRDRKSGEEPKYPHNVQLGILAQTGLIGGLLFAGFLVSSLIAIGRIRLRGGEDLSRGVAGIIAVVFAYWFVHSIGDWFWAFPALTAPVFAWLGMGMRLESDPVAVPAPRWAKRARPALIGATVLATVFAVASLALPWTSAIDVDRAIAVWRTDPAAAFDRLDQARKLNFLSARADLVQGEIASQLGEHRRMRSSFDRALERDPRNWYATLELATLDGIEGRRDQALARLDRVSELNPQEPITATVRNGILRDKPPTLADVDRAFLERYCRVLGLAATANGDCA
jgi:O-Antigen ligase